MSQVQQKTSQILESHEITPSITWFCYAGNSSMLSTPPKIYIEPENDGLEDDFPFPGV